MCINIACFTRNIKTLFCITMSGSYSYENNFVYARQLARYFGLILFLLFIYTYFLALVVLTAFSKRSSESGTEGHNVNTNTSN